MNHFELIAQLIRDQAEASGMQLQDVAREFLSANTNHADSTWWKMYADDTEFVAEQVYLHAIGDPDAVRVDLLCGNMVDLFNGVCGALGLQSRSIWLYSDYPGYVLGHTYIEILNAETEKWEIQDADFNVYYVDIRTGERVGVMEMLNSNDSENFEPRNASASGWIETETEGLRLGNFFAAQMITTENALHTSDKNLSLTLIPSIAELLPDYAFTVKNHVPDPATPHLTERDASYSAGRATLTGGSGDDYLSYDGGSGSYLPILIGGAGNDTLALRLAAGQLYGNTGDDILVGSVYADILSGGAGVDYMAGGAGDDRYIVQFGDGVADTINGFGVGADRLVMLNALGTGGIGQTTLEQDEFDLRFDQTVTENGVVVRYDINGDAVYDGQILFEGRDTIIKAGEVDFSFKDDPLAIFNTTAVDSTSGSYAQAIFGAAGSDSIIYTGTLGAVLAGSQNGVNSGDDTIQSRSNANCSFSGQDGNDILIGGGGDDFMNGGFGNDILRGRGGNDYFVFTKNAGSDVIEDFSSADDTFYVYGWTGAERQVLQVLEDDGLLISYDLNADGIIDGNVKLIGQNTVLEAHDFLFG